MQIFAILYNAAGDKLGSGEIASAYEFESTRRLSRAGRFAFTCPLNDPRLLDIDPVDGRAVLSEKRTVRVFGILPLTDGTLEQRELGGGIIDRIARTAPDTLRVEGDDFMRELTYRSVLGLQNFDLDEQSPSRVLFEDDTSPPPAYTDLTLSYDGNPATFDSFILPAAGKYLLVGYLSPFLTIRFDMSAFNNNAANMNFGFSAGEEGSWSELEPFSDSTVSGGAPLAQDGTVVYTARPGEWAPTLIDGSTLYWIRMDPDAALDNVDLNETYVGVPVPTTSDLSNIMALAPAGWALDTTDWYGSTTLGSFYRFTDENVLEALIRTAEITGEHFRLGGTREIEWMRKGTPDSGVHAVQVLDPSLSGATVCFIVDIEEVTESYELATRVYPGGAGMGSEAIDISQKTTPDVAGYPTGTESVVQTDTSTQNFYYIQSTAGVTAYGRIETNFTDKGIGPADGFGAPDDVSADALFLAAQSWIEKHDAPQYFYRLSVVGLEEELKVGETIRVQYRRVVEEDGVPVLSWDIDQDFIIIETVNRVGLSGAHTVGLTVSTVADWWSDDAEVLSELARTMKDYQTHNQGVSRFNIR